MRLAFLVMISAVGCAGSPTPVETAALPTGMARVCVLRPEKEASALTMEVKDNGRLVGATRGATYFCYLAMPGRHQITSLSDDTGPALLSARSGAHYWLHQEVSAFDGSVHAHFALVDETEALELLGSCESRVLVSVPGHDDRDDALPIAPAKL